jgi:hypothetical protein
LINIKYFIKKGIKFVSFIVKRIKHVNNKLLKYIVWREKIIKCKLLKSFSKNFFLVPRVRLSYIFKDSFSNKNRQFYNSQSKLQCVLSYSFSVPYRKNLTSRFFLSKGLNKLVYCGYQK